MDKNRRVDHAARDNHVREPSTLARAVGIAVLSLSELAVLNALRADELPITDRSPATNTTTQQPFDGLRLPPLASTGSKHVDGGGLSLNANIRPIRPRLFFGGGTPPKEALELFAGWSGGRDGKIVAIGWGSKIPQEYFEDFNRALIASGGPPATKMLEILELDGDMSEALCMAEDATGIFIMGGDQVQLMRAMHKTKVGAYLQKRLQDDSLVIGGTSAGTAVASHNMIGGNGKAPEDLEEHQPVQHRTFFMIKGLALVPKEVVLEQHCLRPGRLDRLHDALRTTDQAKYGIGIEDGGCVIVTSDLTLHVVGPSKVHIVRKEPDGSTSPDRILEHGETYEILSK